MDTIPVSFPLAFAAGVVSFLSPCVLPVVPGYVTFVSGLTLEELRDGERGRARRVAFRHAILFQAGFGLVFLTLGAVATVLGRFLVPVLPWLTRLGGLVIVVFGLHLLGLLRIGLLQRDTRRSLASRPAGALGSFLVGVAFGAGWSPCIGPILGTILLYAGLQTTVLEGTALLAVYALGLGMPFVGVALGFHWFLARARSVRRWVRPLEVAAGTLLVAVGVLMVSGHFETLSTYLAGMGQLINLEP